MTVIDLHVHTRLSGDNDADPLEVIRAAKRAGLDAVCITEHHSVEISEPLEELGRREGLLVLRGAEASTDSGHILLYGAPDDRWNRWAPEVRPRLEAQAVIDEARALGAATAAAHPFRKRMEWPMLERLYALRGLDAVEVCNGAMSDADNLLAKQAAERLGLASIGGSDAHFPEDVGLCATVFEDEIRSIEDLVEALKAGRCRPRY